MRCILRTAIVFRPIISSAVLCLVQVTLLGACTSTKQPLGASDQQPAATVVNALATSPALDTPPPAPEGVDGELWARLVAELERVLAEEGTARRTAAVPTGQASAVCDLGSYTASGSTYYTWSYRNQGDYDLNGEVNIADLTMIGLHFGKNTLSDDWQQAQLADGDSNMEVNIADVTPIGTNFGGRIDGYELQKSPDGTQPYTMMADYGFTPGDVTTGIYPPFEHIGPLVIFGPTFRVVPYVDDGGQRAYGIASYVVGSGNNNLGDRWHTSRANNFRDGLAMVEGPAGIGGTWSVDLEGFSELNLFAEPVVDQTGMIYLGTTSQSVLTEMLPGHFYAVSPQGDLEWDYSTISGVGMAAATNRRGRIVIGDISGMVYCLASDGKQYWRQQLAGGLVFGGPLLDDAGTVFILSHTLSISGITSSTLYKLTPDGEIDWSRALDRPCQGAPVFSPDGHVTVVDELGEV